MTYHKTQTTASNPVVCVFFVYTYINIALSILFIWFYLLIL